MDPKTAIFAGVYVAGVIVGLVVNTSARRYLRHVHAAALDSLTRRCK